MNIYEFHYPSWSNKIFKDVLDVEEKPKTYRINNKWTAVIKKSDIGRCFTSDRVYLLEDDEKKARELIAEKLQSDIQIKMEQIESLEKDIEELKDRIKELQGGIANG